VPLEASLYGCIIKTFLHATGTLTVSGPRLTLTPTSARNKVTKTCGRSTDEQLTLDPSSYAGAWRETPMAPLDCTSRRRMARRLVRSHRG